MNKDEWHGLLLPERPSLEDLAMSIQVFHSELAPSFNGAIAGTEILIEDLQAEHINREELLEIAKIIERNLRQTEEIRAIYLRYAVDLWKRLKAD